MPPGLSRKAGSFTESVIREMTRLNLALNGPEKAVNFAQGFPDFPPSPEIIEAAKRALDEGFNQYATTWGAPQLREAVAAKQSRWWGRAVDAAAEVTVACGATEAMIATMLATLDPGDEVVIFEPFYENYGPDCILSGAVPRYVALRAPDWSFDEGELRAAFGPRTRAIVVNTPHNPTGKVFSREELTLIAALCQEHGAIALTDEIYEHLVYRGEHISMATLPGMEDRTITISGASKTFSVTGWRVGWVIAPPSLTAGLLASGWSTPPCAGASPALAALASWLIFKAVSKRLPTSSRWRSRRRSRFPTPSTTHFSRSTGSAATPSPPAWPRSASRSAHRRAPTTSWRGSGASASVTTSPSPAT